MLIFFYILFYVIGNDKDRGPRCANWAWTMNNPKYTEDELWKMLSEHPEVKGAVFQREKGEDGTEHYQGYIELHKSCRGSGLKKILGDERIHSEKPRSSRYVNIRYCSKEETKIGETMWIGSINEAMKYGSKHGNQGARTDLSDAVKLYMEKGENAFEEMIEEGKDNVVRYKKSIVEMAKSIELKNAKDDEKAYWKEQARLRSLGKSIEGQKQRRCVLYFGPSGCGKTTEVKMQAAEADEDLYEKKGDTKWWDGYEGEAHVLLDEFTGDSYGNIEDFNRMTNVGVYQGEVKGGHIHMKATHVHLTSNRHPSQWWKRKGEEKYSNWRDPRFHAVARRFAKVYWWNQDMELNILINPNDGGNEEDWLRFWKWLKAPRSDFGFDVDLIEWQQEKYFSLPPKGNSDPFNDIEFE